MNLVPVLNYCEFIAADGDTLTTDSLKVASAFGKRHDNVLAAIATLLSDLPDSHRLYFQLVMESMTYVDSSGATRSKFTGRASHYTMTRDGFTLLAMRFTGKKALTFQLAYMDAFNAMAAHIKNQREGLSYRRAKHDLACKDSERRGSYHGRGLNERKQELPLLLAEEKELRLLSQPMLPGMTTH